MTTPCPHADGVTVAWIYGEGPASHEDHVATCPDCQATLAEHADVVALTGDVWMRVAHRQRPRPWVRLVATMTATVAASALLWAGILTLGRVAPDAPTPVDTDAVADAPLGDTALDARLDALDATLLDLSLDLSEL